MRSRTAYLLALLALGVGLAPAPAAAQSAAAILETALAQHEARTRNIENYTVVQNVMGVETTVYFEREAVDGRQQFRSRVVRAAGQRVPESGESWDSPYESFMDFASRARYQGTETVAGHEAHVLVIDDLSDVPGLGAPPGQPQDVQMRSATLYLDASDHVLRRMVVEGVAAVDGESRPVTMRSDFEDYRDIDGLLHPFRTVMSTEGLTANVSAEDLEEARRGLEELRAQMDEMPAMQRRMMERAIRPRMEQMEQMLEEGTMEFTIEVSDVRVNTGPPTG